ncbi:SDR family oxidoreductase [Microbacteriaceae bacterium K1510]|nr:SDR family oxidoreductase [Microbacteriaceae bacterium K1510]
MSSTSPRILVLGASGLIGAFIASDLRRRGYPVIAAARRFTPAQRTQFGPAAREVALATLDAAALALLLREIEVDLVVNCLGVLQDNASDSTRDVHETFVADLLAALGTLGRPVLLVHISVPGQAAEDRTQFSLSKRRAEQAIIASNLSYAILRPGFVFAPRAYGGSALLRALAALPFELPAGLSKRPFATVAAEDIAETIAVLADRWRSDQTCAVTWDLMHPRQATLGDVASLLRAWVGNQSCWRLALPEILLTVSASLGDMASWLGWRPSIRSTALAELRRGVTGDPSAWMEQTGIAPRTLAAVLEERPATIQELWFVRLYLLKAVILASLVVFWCASALIALTVAYPAAVAILTMHGYPDGAAQFMTVAGSIMDFCVGVAIAFRRTNRLGLLAGIGVSLFYMIGAAVLTPDLWIEPLGALVKTFPAIILMLVALAIVDDR